MPYDTAVNITEIQMNFFVKVCITNEIIKRYFKHTMTAFLFIR